MATAPSRPRITAVLGPTNTGKTYLAIERMLGHASGMMGFPLRLLARENYDRVVGLKGKSRVALITGEEKIVPPLARYFLCTVESMPLDRPVAFLGIDEVQLAADPDRGHIFTDRLLRARGIEETMLLGADTIRPLIRRLVPEAEFVSRPRFSVLSYTGPKKLTRLPRRSAAIAFSASDVYALAELMRRQRGGAAVVLGALSPRARNAQVAMFQSGDVDHIIATDAIGMGLNMDIDHVAFARLTKFDGRRARRLAAAEIAQIAGRAGRHMSDGSFGTTTEIGPLDPETVAAVEEHRFDKLTGLYWRNPKLRFGSVRELLASLEQPPATPELMRSREADDHLTLAALARDAEILKRTRDPASVRLLWDVCQIPDYRKILTDAHTALLRRVFLHLTSHEARLPEDWVAANIGRLDRTEGDIDTLATRIAHIRTWTYVAYRADWLADPMHWQETTRAIEDRLSDALHHALTHRFVDRRVSTLLSRLKDRVELAGAVDPSGQVTVEGLRVGRLEGFRFVADRDGGEDARALIAAAQRALRGPVAKRLAQLEASSDDELSLTAEATILWRGEPVARLHPGRTALAPRVEPLTSELLDGVEREKARRRAASWFGDHVAAALAPLVRLREAELSGAARGIAFQLCERLGSVPRRACESEIAVLTQPERKQLAGLGVHIGRESVYLGALLKPDAVRVRALLWAAYRGGTPVLPPRPAQVAFPLQGEGDDDACYAIGYRPFRGAGSQGRAVRVDMVERLLAEAFKKSKEGSFRAGPELCGLAGCGPKELAVVLGALGFVAKLEDDGVTFHVRPRRRTKHPKAARGKKGTRREARAGSRDSPFAKLRDLDFER
ncbi:MAG: helicase-related protein [Alphaproteobacteria bacterium]